MAEEPAPTPGGDVPSVLSRVEIYWSDDKKYYAGTVVAENENGTHAVQYDDGDREDLNMRVEVWRPFKETASTPVEPGSTAAANSGAPISQSNGGSAKPAPKPKPGSAAGKTRVPAEDGPKSKPSATPTSLIVATVSAAPADTYASKERPSANEVDAPKRPSAAKRRDKTPTSSGQRSAAANKSTPSSQATPVVFDSDDRTGASNVTSRQPGPDDPAESQRVGPARHSVDAKPANGDEMDVEKAVDTGDDDDDDVVFKPRGKSGKSPTSKKTRSRVRASPSGRAAGARGIGSGHTGKRRRMALNLTRAEDEAAEIGAEKVPGTTPASATAAAEAASGEAAASPKANDPSVLPLDHVMTAVVQATVMILDQRLRPIADRLDQLTREIQENREAIGRHGRTEVGGSARRSACGAPGVGVGGPGALNLDYLAQMVTQQHSEHVDQIDRLRREVKKLRAEHRSAIGETVAIRETELRNFVEQSIHRVVSAVGHASAAAADAPVGISAVEVRDSRGRSQGICAQGDLSQGHINGTSAADVDRRAKALQLVARKVTVWLLETQHECHDPARAGEWAKETAVTCFTVISSQLSQFKSYSHAFGTLVVSLGDDNVELGWFLRPSEHGGLPIARANYSSWDPPPSDDEWDLEQILLTEVAARFHRALRSYNYPHSVDDLTASVELSRAAAVSESTETSP
jgi:hypothetical protein